MIFVHAQYNICYAQKMYPDTTSETDIWITRIFVALLILCPQMFLTTVDECIVARLFMNLIKFAADAAALAPTEGSIGND